MNTELSTVFEKNILLFTVSKNNIEVKYLTLKNTHETEITCKNTLSSVTIELIKHVYYSTFVQNFMKHFPLHSLDTENFKAMKKLQWTQNIAVFF